MTAFVPGYQDIMRFCENRLDRESFNAIIKGNPQGLSDPEVVETALKAGDFISVLLSVCGERNEPLKLDWLRANEHRFQLIFPYERVLAEFMTSPTKETMLKKAMPLFKMATYRNQMDALCSTDSSIKRDLCFKVESAYFSILSDKMKEHLAFESFSLENQREILNFVLSGLQELEQNLELDNVSSPNWLEHFGLYGLASYFEVESYPMKPESEWKEIRLGFVREQIEAVEKHLAKM